MRSVLGSLRRLIFGETWTIPLGVGVSLGLALLMRAVLPERTWQTVGGFCLAVLVLAVLVNSLPPRARS